MRISYDLEKANVGSIVFPNVALVTPAKDPYHAKIAVSIPRYPPILVIAIELPNVPMVSNRKVSARATKIAATIPLTPNEAIVM